MNHFINGFQEKEQKENPKDGLTVMHLMEKEDTNLAEDKKEKKDQNTQHVDQHLLNAKQREKEKVGVKQSNYETITNNIRSRS
jgi:hypothetical protein